MFSPYDCGSVIYKNPELAKKAHSQDGSYLDIFKDGGIHGFHWQCMALTDINRRWSEALN